MAPQQQQSAAQSGGDVGASAALIGGARRPPVASAPSSPSLGMVQGLMRAAAGSVTGGGGTSSQAAGGGGPVKLSVSPNREKCKALLVIDEPQIDWSVRCYNKHTPPPTHPTHFHTHLPTHLIAVSVVAREEGVGAVPSYRLVSTLLQYTQLPSPTHPSLHPTISLQSVWLLWRKGWERYYQINWSVRCYNADIPHPPTHPTHFSTHLPTHLSRCSQCI